MVGFIGFLDDPGNKDFGLFPWLRQQFKGNHIQHLDSLVDLLVQSSQIVQPEEEEAEDRNDDEDIEHDDAKIHDGDSFSRELGVPDVQHFD